MAKKTNSRLQRKEAIEGYLCIAPWLFGFVFLTLGAVIFSFIMSLTKWDMINPAKFVGGSNYGTILFDDDRFRQSLKITAIYAGCAVPLRSRIKRSVSRRAIAASGPPAWAKRS